MDGLTWIVARDTCMSKKLGKSWGKVRKKFGKHWETNFEKEKNLDKSQEKVRIWFLNRLVWKKWKLKVFKVRKKSWGKAGKTLKN